MSSPPRSSVAAPWWSARARPQPGPALQGGVVLGLVTAVVSAFGVWLTWRIFVDTAAGQRVDQAVFEGALYGRNSLWHVAQPVLDVISVPYLAAVLVAAVLIAVVRRRWGLALQVALLVGGANLTTQVLKSLFDRPDLNATPLFSNALPSGHTTAAASVSAALVFVVPPRARPWAAILGAVYTSATGVSTLIGRWHRPSDVAAAVLVVMAWSGLACALAAARPPSAGGRLVSTASGQVARPDRWTARVPAQPAEPRRHPAAPGAAGGLLVLAGVAAALPAAWALHTSWTTPGDLGSRSELLVAYGGGAFGVVAICCLAFAALLVVRRSAGGVT
ncbi:phosphatase PAP2 family protein [Pengzhenrongella sp.]|uniref:phosphatase PAP2 family protein n=1 Tax=Pengzhenrongella sp. TaxID=2888820 RepID=UPI002F94967B